MFGRSPDQRRKSSGMYGYPRDLTQELARMRALKANATANPAEPDLAGFGSFEYVDLGAETGSELATATTIKEMTTTISSEQGTLVNKAKLAAALVKMAGFAFTRQQRAGSAVAPMYARAVELLKAGVPKVAFDYIGAQTEARGGLIAFVAARKAEAGAATPTGDEYKSWTEEEIKNIQRALVAKGYSTGGIDGIVGPMTALALHAVIGVDKWTTMAPVVVVDLVNAARSKPASAKPDPAAPLIVPQDYGASKNKGLIIGLVAAGAVAVVGAALYLKRRGRGRTTTVTYQPALSGLNGWEYEVIDGTRGKPKGYIGTYPTYAAAQDARNRLCRMGGYIKRRAA